MVGLFCNVTSKEYKGTLNSSEPKPWSNSVPSLYTLTTPTFNASPFETSSIDSSGLISNLTELEVKRVCPAVAVNSTVLSAIKVSNNLLSPKCNETSFAFWRSS